MNFLKTFVLICFVTVATSEVSNVQDGRQKRQIVTRFDEDSFIRQNEYNFCLFQNKTLPCLPNYVCKANKGDFISYCGDSDDEVCCYVTKTCESRSSSSHAVIFQNPSYPKSDEGARFCKMDLQIQRGICALRIDFSIFELALYEKDFCPSDSFMILGTDSVVAPMCGNLTGFSSTLEVTSSNVLQMGFTIQGTVPYRFFLEIIMLPCNDIYPFISPIQAGHLNSSSKPYIPSFIMDFIKALKELQSLKNATENANTTVPDGVNVTVTEPGDIETTERPRKKETSYEVVIKAPNDDSDRYGKSIVTDAMNVVPRSSLFQRIFDEKAGQENCGIYDEPTDTVEISRSEPLIPIDDFSDVSCWSYDSETAQYVYAENCRPTVELPAGEPTFRVIKGSFANLNEYPWQAAIIYNKTFVCGGSLITNRHVLTAAHCVHGGFKKGLEHLYVSLGDHDLATKNDTNNTVRHVKKIIINFHYFPISVTNDIAIIELMEPVEYSYSVKPIKIPADSNELYENQEATVAGWGRFSIKSRKTSPILKEFTSTVSNIDECVEEWKTIKKISAIKDMHICLNISTGTPCHGDSGGPLISCNNGHCSVIGIVSFAFPLCKDVGLPAVFTRVTHFKRWIDINTTPLYYKQRFSDDFL